MSPNITELKLQHYQQRLAASEDQIAELRAKLAIAEKELEMCRAKESNDG